MPRNKTHREQSRKKNNRSKKNRDNGYYHDFFRYNNFNCLVGRIFVIFTFNCFKHISNVGYAHVSNFHWNIFDYLWRSSWHLLLKQKRNINKRTRHTSVLTQKGPKANRKTTIVLSGVKFYFHRLFMIAMSSSASS